MNTPDGSNTPTNLNRVLEKIAEIVKKSADGGYIYRGEHENYDKVSSNLYRESPNMNSADFGVAEIQEFILGEAKAYIGQTASIDKTDDIGLLTQIQHFGGKTNLIDFTEDYLIALFFACDGSHEKDGRIILLKRKSDDYKIRRPPLTIKRVEYQKSIFVESENGVVEPELDRVVTIPADLKFPILDYLKNHHRISIATIYNDLHGFIRRSAYTEYLKAVKYQREARETEKRPLPMKDCDFLLDGDIYNLSDFSHFEVCLREGPGEKLIDDYQIRGFYRNPDPDTRPYGVIGNPNLTYTKERCHNTIDNILAGKFDLDANW